MRDWYYYLKKYPIAAQPIKMPIIPAIPARLSGDGGLNPIRENIAPIESPNAPDCNADINSDLLNNSFIL